MGGWGAGGCKINWWIKLINRVFARLRTCQFIHQEREQMCRTPFYQVLRNNSDKILITTSLEQGHFNKFKLLYISGIGYFNPNLSGYWEILPHFI